jgi:toxin-antitoxin system PIN domain toxin
MISIDANILIFAVDNASSFQAEAIRLLHLIYGEGEELFLCWEVLYGFRRIATGNRILKEPLSTQDADAFIDNLISHPSVSILSPSRESWLIFQRYSQEMKLTGNLVTDAVIASQLEANGVKKLYSNDRDFRKFSYLKVIDPFQKKKQK